ncbi:MAG: roadblock/LC7 domain-containing protein [Candidatus Baldrarchaeia archaeon]
MRGTEHSPQHKLLERLAPLIRELERNPDVEGVALVSRTGLKIWGYTSTLMNEEIFSAATAAIIGIGERTTKDLGYGDLNNITVVGEKGFVVMTQIGREYMIAIASVNKTKIGYYMLMLQRYSKMLSKALEEEVAKEELSEEEKALLEAIDALEE